MKYEIKEHLNCIDIDICGVKYRIKSMKQSELINTDAIAETDFFEKEIRICPINYGGYKLGSEKIQETLFHELAHAFLDQTGQIDINDERTAEVMAMFARQILITIDNDFLDMIYRMNDKVINES